MYYPMFAVPLRVLLEMTALEPHEALREAGRVVELPPCSPAIFVSHEWCGRWHPDPKFRQFRVLQGVLVRAIAGTLRIEADIFSVVAFQMRCTVRPKDFAGLADYFVWYDFFSAPQPGSLPAGSPAFAETEAALVRAIDSLPAYVEQCRWFVVLAPTVRHEDGRWRDYASWKGRGWCRFERLSRVLCSKDPTVLLIADGQSLWQVAAHQSLIEPVGGGNYTVEGDKTRLAIPVRRLLQRKLQELLDQGRSEEYSRMMGLRAQLTEGLGLDWQMVAPRGLAVHRRMDSLEDFVQLFQAKLPLNRKRRETLLLQASALGDVAVMTALLDARARVDCREPRDVPVFLSIKGLSSRAEGIHKRGAVSSVSA